MDLYAMKVAWILLLSLLMVIILLPFFCFCISKYYNGSFCFKNRVTQEPQ